MTNQLTFELPDLSPYDLLDPVQKMISKWDVDKAFTKGKDLGLNEEMKLIKVTSFIQECLDSSFPSLQAYAKGRIEGWQRLQLTKIVMDR